MLKSRLVHTGIFLTIKLNQAENRMMNYVSPPMKASPGEDCHLITLK